MINLYGSIESTDERILNVFINLKTEERKLIMSSGSLKNFLLQSERVSVDGNTLYPRRSVPQQIIKQHGSSNTDWRYWVGGGIDTFTDHGPMCKL